MVVATCVLMFAKAASNSCLPGAGVWRQLADAVTPQGAVCLSRICCMIWCAGLILHLDRRGFAVRRRTGLGTGPAPPTVVNVKVEVDGSPVLGVCAAVTRPAQSSGLQGELASMLPHASPSAPGGGGQDCL